MKKKLEYGYEDKEWVVASTSLEGIRCIKQCDTMEQAIELLHKCTIPVGIMTTAFYNNKVDEEYKLCE